MTEEHQVSGDQQTWRVLAHASAFIQFIGVPSVVGPLIVWLIRREDPFVEPHARAALNFQLSLLIYFVVGTIAAVIAVVTIIGIPLAVLIVIFLVLLLFLELLFALLATLAASKGQLYSYPMSIELVKG